MKWRKILYTLIRNNDKRIVQKRKCKCKFSCIHIDKLSNFFPKKKKNYIYRNSNLLTMAERGEL